MNQSHVLLDLLSKGGNVGTWSYDPITQQLDADAGTCTLMQCASAEVHRLPELLANVRPADRALLRQDFQSAIAKQEPFERTFHLQAAADAAQICMRAGWSSGSNPGAGVLLGVVERSVLSTMQCQVLQHRFEHLRSVLESSPVNMFEQDLELRYEWALAPRVDLGTDMITGHMASDFMEPGCATEIDLFKRSVLETGKPERRRVYIQPKGQKGGDFDVYLAPRHGLDGRLNGVISVAIDMAELTEHEQRMLAMFERAPMGIVLSRRSDGVIVNVNQHFLNIFGYTSEETLGSTALLLQFWQLPEQRAQMLQELQKNGFVHNMITGFRHKGGRTGRVLVSVENVEIAGEKLMLGMLSDVTEVESARQALIQSEARYRTLFNAIDEGYCIIEILFDAQDQPVNYRYLEVNESFERQTGLTGAVGKTILQLIPNIESCWLQAYGKVAQTGEPVRLDDYVADMNRWFNVYAFRLGDPSKRQVGVIFSNSTERKVLEHQLLEAVVSADTANRAKSDFLASMSHELRTPLNSILGFAQLIETGEPPLTPQQKRNLDHILKGGWYLLELIDEVLDLSHIESGKLSLSLEAVSLVDILRDCQELIEPMAQKRAIRMTFTQLETAPFAFVDRIRVKQVLLNLLSNAIKYNTSHGSVVVECTLKRPGIARISIRDAGVGMTPKQIAQLFQPFNRLGREAGVEAGTGIGLVVTKRLVEMMEGTVGVESTLGKGSVFWIELPLVATPLQVLAAA